MANDNQKSHGRRHGSRSTYGHSHSHGHGNHHSSSKQSRKQHTPNPPILALASSQWDSPSHYAQPQAQMQSTSNTTMSTIAAEPVPAVDPETMPAKQGLNDWGAFSGGASPGDSAAGSMFGFGPLLFHHIDSEQSANETCPSQTQEKDQIAREADAFEMDRLLLNDPISFNPLQAISWAKLDHDTAKGKRKAGSPASTELRGDEDGGSGAEFQQPADTGGFGVDASFQHSRRDDYAGNRRDMQLGNAGMNTKLPEDTHAPYAVSCAAIDQSEASSTPLGSMSKTLSSVSQQQSPNMTDGRSTFVRPQTPSVPTPNTSHGSGRQGQRQQRRHRHRHGTRTSHAEPSSGQTQNESYQQQQQTYPVPVPTAFPPFAGAPPVSVPPQHPYPLAQQASYNTYQTSPARSYAPCPLQPTQQQTQDVFLCLGPYCSARFASEGELNVHYRAEHSLTCSWVSCGASGFTSNNALVWHVKAEHLLLCPMPGCCDGVFASKKELEGHIRVK